MRGSSQGHKVEREYDAGLLELTFYSLRQANACRRASTYRGLKTFGSERRRNVPTQTDSDEVQRSTSWSYLFILHMDVKKVESWLEAYNAKEEIRINSNIISSTKPFLIPMMMKKSSKGRKRLGSSIC